FWVERRSQKNARRSALAEYLDLEGATGHVGGEFRRYVALGQRQVDVMAVAARRGPPDDISVVPDRLIAQHVGVARVDDETHAPQLPAVRLFREGGFATDEVPLAEVDETVQPGFERAIDRAEFSVPGWKVLLEPQREQRAHAEMHDAKAMPGFHDRSVETSLVLRPDPDFIAKITRVCE